MNRWFIPKVLALLIILLLTTGSVDCARNSNSLITRRDAVQTAPVEPSTISGITNAQISSRYYNSTIPGTEGYVDSNTGKQFSFRSYVTPEDQTIEALTAQISDAEDAYNLAVQWVHVSEEKLNHATDKWLTPHEFIADTPHYTSNPLKSEEVSDCEEQANTLVYLIHAQGTRPEEVRVALGEVTFDDIETGHAWVELLTNGQWLAIDPSWGPYWDDRGEKLVRRHGIPFDYYSSHAYPALQVWIYYNDIYYLDPSDGSGSAPAVWYAWETD